MAGPGVKRIKVSSRGSSEISGCIFQLLLGGRDQFLQGMSFFGRDAIFTTSRSLYMLVRKILPIVCLTQTVKQVNSRIDPTC